MNVPVGGTNEYESYANAESYGEEEMEELEAPIMTLDEILEDPYYQAQFDKKMSKSNQTAIENAKLNWEKEYEAKVAEDQKLASMDEIQRRDYEIERLTKENEIFRINEQASKLREEAIRQATEKGIPIEVMTQLDYTRETAESLNAKIDTYAKAFRNTRSTAIDEYSKEPAPQVGERTSPEPKSGYEKFLQENS